MEDPRKDFRHALKAKDELADALKALIQTMRDSVLTIYNNIFDELESEADKRKVTRKAFDDREYTLNGIKNLTSINSLKRKELSASNYKSEQLRKIIAATPAAAGGAREPETYFVSGKAATISNEAELNAYLEDIRKDMLEILKNDKTIILK